MKKGMKRNIIAGLLLAFATTSAVGAVALNQEVASAENEAVKTFYVTAGASVRATAPTGIRFKGAMDKTVYNDVMTEENGVEKQVGMYVFPASYYNNAAAFSDGNVANYHNLKQKLDYVFYDSANADVDNLIYSEDGETYYMNAVVGNVLLQNYDLEFVAVAYIAETTAEGTAYTYAAMDYETTATSIAETSAILYDDCAGNDSVQAVLFDYIEGAYLDSVGVTYDKATQSYQKDGASWATIDEAIEGLGANFALTISKSTIEMTPSAMETLTATVKNGGDDTVLSQYVQWKSSDNTVATVENGKVSAIKEGNATITATLGAMTATCDVTVVDAREEVTLTQVDFDLSANEGLTVAVEGVPTSVFVNGENVTATATLANGSATIAYDDISGMQAGKTFAVEVNTAEKIYKLNVFAASYVISNETEWIAYRTAASSSTLTDTSYAILDASFSVAADNSYNGNGTMKGVLDGRGNVIDGLVAQVRFFNNFNGTLKDIGFTNYNANGWYGQNHSFINVLNGSLENVYIHVKGMTATSTSKPWSIVNSVSSGATLTNVIIDTSAMTDKTKASAVVGGASMSGTLSNVYCIGTIQSLKNDADAGRYDTLKALYNANNNFLNGFGDVWSLDKGYLVFGENKLGVCASADLGNFDYDLTASATTSASLVLDGFNGKAEEVLVDGADVTAVCDLTTEGQITVPYAAMSTLSTGVKDVSITTKTTLYTAKVTVATYVISDVASFQKFYGDFWALDSSIRNSDAKATNVTSGWYVVLSDSFSMSGKDLATNKATGTTNNSYASGDTFMGTIDGRGHVIDGISVDRALFSRLRNGAVIKNIGFTNAVCTIGKSNTDQRAGFLALGISGGSTIDNVYVQVETGSWSNGKTKEGLISYCDSSTITNCVFEVKLRSGTPAQLIGGESWKNMTVSNCHIVSSKGTVPATTLALSATTSVLVSNFLNAETSKYALPTGLNSYWAINETTGALTFGSATVHAAQ